MFINGDPAQLGMFAKELAKISDFVTIKRLCKIYYIFVNSMQFAVTMFSIQISAHIYMNIYVWRRVTQYKLLQIIKVPW